LTDEQQDLFPWRIERISRLGTERSIPVPNSSEAHWVQDASGRRWVIKWEDDTGVEPLLAETVSWLLGDEIGVPQPKAAVFLDENHRAWMSEVVPNVVHWEPRHAHLLINAQQLGAMLALDAICHNEDRHLGNILVQPDPDELHLRAYAIDSGSALVGWKDFHSIGTAVPSPRNLAPGIPVDLLETGAMAAAQRATGLDPGEILAMISEACEIARDPGGVALNNALVVRLAQAPYLVAAYLERVRSVVKP
jgi:hypothetical protein